MTEKEKAKAYDKSLERAKKWHNAPNIDKMPTYGNRIIEEIFPELKESDDEKIKNAILNYLKKMWGNCQDNVCGVHVEDAIAWLEKQKDKDKLIQELGEYKVKYTQEVLEKYINNMSNKDYERLRKTAIAFLKDFAEQGYENAVECIDWLEKQGEPNPYSGVSFKYNGHTWGMCARDNGVEILVDGEIKERIFLDNEPQGKSALEAIKEEKVDNELAKSLCVEPKFKVGDWVVNKFGDSFHIDSLDKKNYQVSDGKGNYNYFPISQQDKMHLWNIQDAKEGDVLSFYSEYKGNKIVQIGIIEKYLGKYGGCSNTFTFKIYIGVNWDNNLQMGKYIGCSDIHPATKEQRDLLFQKMKEAGYEWDADKKELKKLVEPKFNVGDWVVDNCGYVWKIEGILNQFYLLEGIEGGESRPTIDWVDKTFHLWTIKDGKDGDVLVHSSFIFDDFIFIYNNTSILQAYCYYSNERNRFIIEDRGHHCPWNMQEVTPATKEQRDSLMKAMNDAGYEWDAEKKELKLLVSNQDSYVTDKKDKFDPKTLKPFDKVLACYADQSIWCCGLFSYFTENENLIVCCGDAYYKYCIPYNEETKHLVGTTDDAPEYYKYWEG